MIVKPATHLFNATCPALEEGEEEVWFRHPKWPLECNQLGIIVTDEEAHFITNGRDQYYLMYGKKNFERHFLGTRERIIMECYHQRDYTGWQFHHRDANPYNHTEENLVGFIHRSKEMMKFVWANQNFLDRTIAYMNTRTAILEKRGVDPVDYWKAMELPGNYFKKWVSQSGFEPPEKNKRGEYKIQKRRGEIIANIKQLKAAGKTNAEIRETLGMKGKNSLAYWLKIIKEQNDI